MAESRFNVDNNVPDDVPDLVLIKEWPRYNQLIAERLAGEREPQPEYAHACRKLGETPGSMPSRPRLVFLDCCALKKNDDYSDPACHTDLIPPGLELSRPILQLGSRELG